MHFPFPDPFRSGTPSWVLALLSALPAISPVLAGETNPDISAIGQLRADYTDQPGSIDQDEPTLSLGESELILNAALNPYFKGYFTLAAGEEGIGVEEAYATVLRGLPFGLGLKAGQYRLDMGRLNPVHPHAYPFIDVPRAWVSLMPGGEEGFIEPSVQASILLPTPGDWASTLSADLINGSEFHPDEEATRLGWLGRWSNSLTLGEKAALEAGLSATTGLDRVADDDRGWLGGGDLKVKFYLPASSSLVLQGEGLYRLSHSADSAGAVSRERRFGLYAFADYRHHDHLDIGLLYDQFQREGDPSAIDRSLVPFAGYSVMEETTVIRLAWEFFFPEGGDVVQSATLQFLFTMGPHKPHQF